ncbi:MAG: DUF1573 domain-containing protein [Planctomycetaceae bacterium]
MEYDNTQSGTQERDKASGGEESSPRQGLGILRLAVLAVLTGIIGAYAYLVIAESPPRLKVAEKEIDLGEVPLGETISRSVQVTNGGSRTLLISKVAGSCGCTTATIEKNSLQPNETTSLNLRVVRNTLSPARIQVSIESNDAVSPVTEIALYLKRPWEAMITPTSLSIRGVDRSSLPITRKAFLKTMTRLDGRNIGSVTASSASKYLEVDVHPHSKNTEFDIEVKVLANAPAGNWREQVNLTDSNGLLNSSIEIDASIQSKYLFPVADIVLCPDEKSITSREATIQLGRRDGGKFDVSEVTLDEGSRPWLTVEQTEADEPLNRAIRLRHVPLQLNERRPSGHVLLILNGDYGMEPFCIPVSACH